MRILLIEDELDMAFWLMRALKQGRFVPDHAADAGTAEALMAATDYDAIVLDLRLPDRHGLALLADMRKAGNRTPVLILSAQGSLQDRVRGLNIGADDFMSKPFELEELEARLSGWHHRAGHALRRRYTPWHHRVGAGDCTAAAQSLVGARYQANPAASRTGQRAGDGQGTGRGAGATSVEHCQLA
jgi:two-component system response regulator TctD